jgi:hypothetical protein
MIKMGCKNLSADDVPSAILQGFNFTPGLRKDGGNVLYVAPLHSPHNQG